MPTSTHGQITEKSDKTPIKLRICNPEWFKPNDTFSISNPLNEAKDLQFSGEDLNFLARALYAEAAGRLSKPDDDERKREKTAIIHVCYFRLNRKGYPSNAYIAKTFTEVLKAPGQFESVFKANTKLNNSSPGNCESLPQGDCKDLMDSLQAVKDFIDDGPNFKSFPFDKFLAASGRKGWTPIGGNEFSLFPANKAAMEKASSR